MIIQRTLAEFLVSKMAALAVFKDELAFQISPQFPYMLTSLTGNKRESLGAGIRDFITETDETKIYRNEQSIRFTFRAVSTDKNNGNEIISDLVRQADEILRRLTMENGITLNDSVTQLPIRIAYTEFINETDIQTITDKLPVVYQKSITYLFRIVDPSVISIQSIPVDSLSINI
ncbi:MAG: hypothetical protein H8D23_23600 [Candidatus Brocadiales bacterium]|nr:hypothetical protein [Candidatus Brocadiales bacterium]